MSTSTFVLDKCFWPTTQPIPEGTCAIYWLCSREDGELCCQRNPLDWVSEDALHHSDVVLRLCILNGALKLSEDMREESVSRVGTKLLMDDDMVRIWSFSLGPGEQSDFHEHKVPYMFVNLPTGKGSSLTQEINGGGDLVSTPRQQGDWEVVSMGRGPFCAHALRNIGEGKFLQFVVEFLAHD